MKSALERLQLARDERLLWSDGPRGGLVFRAFDLVAVPFTILWAGAALSALGPYLRPGAPIFLTFFALLFCGVAAYVTVGRFLLDAWRRRNTRYALTTSRVIIRTGRWRLRETSLNLQTLGEVSIRARRNGVGTITFGPMPPGLLSFGIARAGGVAPPHFELIPDARMVYDLILSRQRELGGANEPSRDRRGLTTR